MDILDWKRILLDDLDGQYTLEVVFRTAVMFAVILIVLRLSGKRRVRQLSVFELAIILGLGSAAGDSMFYKEVGIVTTIIVCFTAIGLYRIITWLTTKSERFEKALEGRPIYIVEGGIMTIKSDNKDSLSKYEFFAELRGKGFEHLGQVKAAILETDGSVSVFFYPDDEVKPGLPILPKVFNQNIDHLTEAGRYACIVCGTSYQLQIGSHRCTCCGHHQWVKAVATKRVT